MGLSEDQVEQLANDYARHCGDPGDEGCEICPLNSEANDVTCAAYLVDICRRPELYEMRGGLCEPISGGLSSRAGVFPAPAKSAPQIGRRAASRVIPGKRNGGAA